MRKIIKATCRNCGKTYNKYEGPGTNDHRRRDMIVRACNSVTCSRKCSREESRKND